MTGCDALLHCANVYTWSPRHQASLVPSSSLSDLRGPRKPMTMPAATLPAT
jgi:hypothetical protein